MPTRKTDTHLLPLLSLLFLLNALDKSNLAAAETAHLSRDLGLQPADVHRSVAVFFALFVALQPVGAALGRRFGCVTWVPACMALWGVATLAMAFLRPGRGVRLALFVLRGLVGALEGFYPTTVAYLALFYTRAQFARRLAIFYGQAALAPAVGGVLSWLVFSWFDEPGGPSTTVSNSSWRPWQLLFLLEGLLTVLVAAVAAVYLPDGPATAWFLTPAERAWTHERVRRDREEEMMSARAAAAGTGEDEWDGSGSGSGSSFSSSANRNAAYESVHEHGRDDSMVDTHSHMHTHTHSAAAEDEEDAEATAGLLPHSHSHSHSHHAHTQKQPLAHALLALLTSPHPYLLLSLNILSALPATGLALFLPLLLAPMAPTPALANLASAPPFLAAAAALWYATALSDRLGDRTRVIAAALVGVGVGCAGLGVGRGAPADGAGGGGEGEGEGALALGLRYLALCVLLAGAYVPSPLTVAWITDNTPGPEKRALWLGVNGWGNVAGVLAAWVFRPADGGGEGSGAGAGGDKGTEALSAYRPAFRTTLYATLLALLGYLFFRRHLQQENARRALVLSSWTGADVEAERRAGRGPRVPLAAGTSMSGRVCAVLWVVVGRVIARVLGPRGARWVAGTGVGRVVGAWRSAPREGDERVTFVYGL